MRALLVAALSLSSPLLACAQSSSSPDSPDSPALAIVNGEPIREDDLDVGGELLDLKQQAYRIRSRALAKAVADRLLAKEAEKRGVSLEELLHEEVRGKVEPPTSIQVEAFYEQQRSRIRQPLEDIRDQVERLLIDVETQKRKDAFVETLRAAGEVKILLDPPRLPVDLSKAPFRGPDDAPVTIVEFSDFQCPFCRRIQPTLAKLQTRYGDKLRWSFKDLPLNSIHPDAQRAAEAARCAGEQDKFWEYRKAMFDTGRISARMHSEKARSLGLDGEKFDACLESGKFRDAVQADGAEAANLGISGTPAFLINGVLLSGAQPLEAFAKVIDRELERAAE